MSYDGQSSETCSVEIGVPQGSILGPLRFILYVNDIHKVSNKLSLIQFADDTSIYATGPSLSDLLSTVEGEMANIVNWLKLNKLSLNVAKTNFMIMNTKGEHIDDNHDIYIDGEKIERIGQSKFLGVIIDQNMNFGAHIHHISNKLSKGIGILIRGRQVLCKDSLKTLYILLLLNHI